MKIVTIIGARPQFIKAAILSKHLMGVHEEILVHTGQHYDANMSDVFFKELEIPCPKYNLGISGESHGLMTGKMLIEIEKVLMDEKPDMVIVYGDTNSTMAGALAAVKLSIPVAHIEAGNTRGRLSNPEDINRTVSDHVSTLLFACVESAMENLKKEGLDKNSYFVGDLMYDSFLLYSSFARLKDRDDLLDQSGNPASIPDKYYYLTCHRQENAGSDKPLMEILSALEELEYPTVYPVHPRNKVRAQEIVSRLGLKKIKLLQPVGYLSSVALMKGAKKVVTDSGGLQREAFFAGKQCVTIFDYAWWPETLKGNMNQLSSPDKREILDKLNVVPVRYSDYFPFGKGDSAVKICEILNTYEKRSSKQSWPST